MADPLTRLKAALAGRYLIERELGQGGMATVLLAQDIKHNRAVAIKVLRPEIAAALGAERFLREIQIAAGLTHPHILTLIDSGDADGLLYYVMPFVEGESLRDRLDREQQLPLDDALEITREIADALSYAHGLGIVHRDIKPENILFQAGHAVVSDFGIARALSAAGSRLTETGIAIGTPAYMSPEQAAGSGDVDGRTDIYSLGCVLYEMLAGEPPFTGPSVQAILARKSVEPARSLRVVRDTVPVTVEQAVAKALARVPADRFASAPQFAEALFAPTAGARFPLRSVFRRRGAQVAFAIAVIGAAAVIGARLLSRDGGAPAGRRPVVVVLPFQNLGAAEDGWFADGMTDEITNHLAEVSGLAVISRTSANQFPHAGKTLRQFAADVGAQFALEGTIRSDQAPGGARRLRVSPRLIRVSDETGVWAEPYTATVTHGEIFDVQASIAERVVQAMDVTLLASERRAFHTRPTSNLEAYDAYLRGNQYAHGGFYFQATDNRGATQMYQRAVDLDPQFAEAHARLSIQLSQQQLAGVAITDPAPAESHARRALALNPDLALGHLALADYYRAYTGDQEHIRTELLVTERSGANTGEILQALASAYGYVGEYERSLRDARRAFELDPLNADNAEAVGYAYFDLRRDAEAETYLDRAIALAPDKPDLYMFKVGLYLSWHGSVPEALGVLHVAVQRMGPERAITGFVQSGSIWSRILASDPWYRSMVQRLLLPSPDLDSSDYYMHKAALFEGLGRVGLARAYYDSVVPVMEGRLRNLPDTLSYSSVYFRRVLALAYAGQGKNEKAIQEARRAIQLDPAGGAHGDIGLALVYTAVGERDSAVAQFERIVAEPGVITPRLLALDPALRSLRGMPRFQRLLKDH